MGEEERDFIHPPRVRSDVGVLRGRQNYTAAREARDEVSPEETTEVWGSK